MLHRLESWISPLTLAAVLACTAPAFAADTAASTRFFDDSSVVALADLDALRGGADVSNQTLINGAVADNQAYNLTTGSNAISSGSFAGSNGFNTVIQNSGNNVLIQSSTIINLQLTQ